MFGCGNWFRRQLSKELYLFLVVVVFPEDQWLFALYAVCWLLCGVLFSKYRVSQN